jgi:hypothetical protein
MRPLRVPAVPEPADLLPDPDALAGPDADRTGLQVPIDRVRLGPILMMALLPAQSSGLLEADALGLQFAQACPDIARAWNGSGPLVAQRLDADELYSELTDPFEP